jgi:hypothetical protein
MTPAHVWSWTGEPTRPRPEFILEVRDQSEGLGREGTLPQIDGSGS